MYVGKELEGDALSNLPLLVEARLAERGELDAPADPEVHELAQAIERARTILEASRGYIRERGIGERDMLALPSVVAERLRDASEGEYALLVALPTHGGDQRVLVREVASLLGDAGARSVPAGAIRLRRRIGASTLIEPLKTYVDERLALFISDFDETLGEKLVAFDARAVAERIQQGRLERRSPEQRERPLRPIHLTTPLVLAVSGPDGLPSPYALRLEHVAPGTAALCALNPALAMAGLVTVCPFRLLRAPEHLEL